MTGYSIQLTEKHGLAPPALLRPPQKPYSFWGCLNARNRRIFQHETWSQCFDIRRGEMWKIPPIFLWFIQAEKVLAPLILWFLLKADNTVPASAFPRNALIHQRGELERNPARRRLQTHPCPAQRCQAKAAGAHPPQPTSSCSSLLRWEHSPPHRSPICFNRSETSWTDRLRFIWHKGGCSRSPRSHPVARFVEVGTQREVKSSRLTFSANTAKEKLGNSLSAQDRLVPPMGIWKTWSTRQVQSAQIQTVSRILQLQTDGIRHQIQNRHDRGKDSGLWANTALQLLLGHRNNVVLATHPTPRTWAEPADRRSQSQTQSLAHTLRFPPA